MTKSFSFSLITLLLIFTSSVVFSQSLDYVQGELLVQLQPDNRPEDLILEYSRQHNTPIDLKVERKLNSPMSIWKFTFDYNAIANDLLIRQLDRMKTLAVVQNNHLISPRATFPDDPLFTSQWQWFNDGSSGLEDADVDAELAWDITTGGMTPDGDEIVVAVLDDGTELTHPDLIDNHWVNTAEIPDNDIDDDGNGYVDDYNGWSIITDNDVVSGGNHGVAVAGMIGAKGNNGIGITGINWDVKIMMIKNNFNTQEDRVLEAYAYPYIMRKRYNESNGTEGAFVVASNASWGIDNGDPADSPLWCQFYDSLGVQGILNCGATSNSTVDIDDVGDLPTTCISDFMVSVTRSSINDGQSGGFGPIHIDLAAPGQNIFSADNNGGYGNTTGTSFSCPLVAGIIGLMYSAPCPNLTALAKSDPGAGALEARRLLLENVDLVAGFEFLVETGGRANAYNVILDIMNNCGPCPGPISLDAESIALTSATLTWTDGFNASSADIRYKAQGSADWISILAVSSPYSLTGLTSCTPYEFQVANECADSMTTSTYTNSTFFTTDGCCEAPNNIQITNVANTTMDVLWDSVTLALSYDVRYRIVGTADWTALNTVVNSINIDELDQCQAYEVSVKTNCAGLNTDFSLPVVATTKGCGACIENDYCTIEGDSNLEFIQNVDFNGIENNSGSNDGYALFDSAPQILDFGSENNLKIFIGYASFSYDETITAFIDYNADGDFSVDENIGNVSQSDSAVFEFTVPLDATLGLTRLRIIMGYDANPNNPCPNSLDGEAEDYCVYIGDPTIECLFDGMLDTVATTTSSISLTWPEQAGASQYQLRWKESINADWNGVLVLENNYELDDLDICTSYDFQVAAICFNGISPFTDPISFITSCNTNTTEENYLKAFTLSPNPFSDLLTITFDAPLNGSLDIQILNNVGQVVGKNELRTISIGANQITLDQLENLNSGIYFLSLTIDDLRKVVKVVKI